MSYTLRETKDVGIGKSAYFCTEQHPKKKENNVGVLTLQLTRLCATTHTAEHITLKCTKVYPVLIANVSVPIALLDKESLRTFINEFVSKEIKKELYADDYVKYDAKQEKSDVSRMSAKALGALSDSLYVPRVLVCERVEPDAKIKDDIYAGSNQKDTGKVTDTGKAKDAVKVKDAGKVKDTGKAKDEGQASDTKKARISQNFFEVRTVAQKDGNSSLKNINSQQSQVQLHFSRVEDVEMIMQGCKKYFRNMGKDTGKDVKCNFPPGSIPQWWKIENNYEQEYKNWRIDFKNIEVLEDMQKRGEWHFYSQFSFHEANVFHKINKKKEDGTVAKVYYIDCSNLRVHE